MAKISKSPTQRSTATIDLGRERKNKIALFRAKRLQQGETIPSLEKAVNILLDKSLEVELATN